MSQRLAKKLLLIGWDAADWQVMLPLLQAGQMPVLQRVLLDGVRGRISSLVPMVSPLLWTSIATGKRADKHGILNFVEPDPDGSGVRPASSTSRRVKALWNILTQQGLRTHVVGWFASHPAEPINGVCVSNVFTVPVGGRDRPWPVPAGAVHPPRLEETLAALRIHPGEIVARQMLPFLPRLPEIDRKDERLVALAVALAQCSTIQRVVAWILSNEPWDFVAAYYNAIDNVSHHFMPYHPPRRAEVPEADFEHFKDVVAAVYRYHDYMLGQLLHLAGPETTLLLLSDHGFASGDRRPAGPVQTHPDQPVEWHRPFGVLAMSGPGVKKGGAVTSASLLDIAPTVLTLLGSPIGDDLEGRPLLEALVDPVQPARIPSWEEASGDCGMHPAGHKVQGWEAREAIAQLVALGYLADPSRDEERAVRVARLQEKLNLAQTYLGAGRPADALPLLQELVVEVPEEPSFPLLVARAQLSLGQRDECRRLAEGVLRTHERHGDAEFILGTLCLAENRAVEAVEHLRRAEHSNPALPELQAALGRAHAECRQWADAERAFRRALADDSDAVAPQLGLAESCLAQLRFRDAADHARQALRRRPRLALAHYYLGVAAMHMGQAAEAEQALGRCLELRPDATPARERLAELRERAREGAARLAETSVIESILTAVREGSGLRPGPEERDEG